MLMVEGLSAAKPVAGARPARSTDANSDRRDRMNLDTQTTRTSTHCAAASGTRPPVDGGGQNKSPARQLFATGRAPTALAAFVKRPQAVRFKSALTVDMP